MGLIDERLACPHSGDIGLFKSNIMLFNGPKEMGVCMSMIWRYFVYSVFIGRYSRSLNSPPFLMIKGLFKSIFTIVLFKWPKGTRGVSTFLTFQIFWIFLCRLSYLEVHYSENCTLHCHQQSAPSSFFPPDFCIFDCYFFILKVVISIFGSMLQA